MTGATSLPGGSMAAAYSMLLLVLLATAFAQVAFKSYHHTARRSFLLTAIVLFVCSPPLAILAARQLGIGKVYVLMSLSYGLVALLGWKLFNEQVSRKQIEGLALITIGCVIYAL